MFEQRRCQFIAIVVSGVLRKGTRQGRIKWGGGASLPGARPWEQIEVSLDST